MSLETEKRAAEPLPQSAKPANHLVRDHVDIVFPADLADPGEISFRRHDDAARAHDWLSNECGNGLRPLTDNHRLKVGRKTGRELLLGLARKGRPIVMRTACVKNARNRQVEVDMVVGQPG